jgi:hypothetical protein
MTDYFYDRGVMRFGGQPIPIMGLLRAAGVTRSETC